MALWDPELQEVVELKVVASIVERFWAEANKLPLVVVRSESDMNAFTLLRMRLVAIVPFTA